MRSCMLLSYARDSDFDSEPLSTKMSAVPAVLELGFGQLSLALYDSDTGLGEVLVFLFASSYATRRTMLPECTCISLRHDKLCLRTV